MAPQDSPDNLRFDLFRLDGARGIVLGDDGAELRLRPKAFALLRQLLAHPGRLLSREELLDAVWPGVMVTDDSLTQCVSELRQAFGARAAQVLRTVPKRGYVLTASVHGGGSATVDVPSEPHPQPADVASYDLAELRRETLTVHRFEAPDSERDCRLLADALTTDLATVLTSLEGLRIHSAANARPGEGYAIKGEVRVVGGAFRVTMHLEEAATGVDIWADRLDLQQVETSELAGSLLTSLSVRIGQQVDRHCLKLARRKPLATLSARELNLIGREHHLRATEADTVVAREMYTRAIAADPDYPHPYSWLAYAMQRAIFQGWDGPDRQKTLEEALRLARRAVEIDPTGPLFLSRLALSLLVLERWDEALAVARTALNSDRPAFTAARDTCSWVLASTGHAAEAVELGRGTLALDPLCPPYTHALLGRSLLLAGKAREAMLQFRLCLSRVPDDLPVYDLLVVAAMESGHRSEALAARREFLRLMPGWKPGNKSGFWFLRLPEDLERFQTAHRRAAELAEAAGAAKPAAPQAPPSKSRVSPPRPVVASVLAGVRQETIYVYPLRAAPDDAAAAHAGAAAIAALTAELVQYGDLSVVAEKGEHAARGFAVRGDVHSAGETFRAHVRLDDLATGTALWAQRVEWPAVRAGSFDDEKAVALASGIDLQVARIGLRRAREKPPEALTARELVLLAKERYTRGTEADTTLAGEMCARASSIDDGYAPAHAWHALCTSRAAIHGWCGPDREQTVTQAVRHARKAVQLQPESPLALASLAHSLGLQEQWQEATALARLALQAGRAAGDEVRFAAADVLAAAGHPEEAVEVLEEAVARNPHCSPLVHLVLGRTLLAAGRPDEAIGRLRLCVSQLPDFALGYRTLVVAEIMAGRFETAREAFQHVLRLRPEWAQGNKPIFWFLRDAESRRRYQDAFDVARRLDGVARAGGLLDGATARA